MLAQIMRASNYHVNHTPPIVTICTLLGEDPGRLVPHTSARLETRRLAGIESRRSAARCPMHLPHHSSGESEGQQLSQARFPRETAIAEARAGSVVYGSGNLHLAVTGSYVQPGYGSLPTPSPRRALPE